MRLQKGVDHAHGAVGLAVVEVFGVENRCAEALRGGKKCCVVVLDPESPCHRETRQHISLIDRDERERAEIANPFNEFFI